MVVHGAIDGFSRLVTYLHCSDNNKSTTVLSLFTDAAGRFGLPSRIRIDRGVENVKVAQFMLEKRGIERKSVLTGSSVHNQIIEQLWHDVFRCVLQLYYRLFYYLELIGELDPLSELDLYALHYVYLPRINRALRIFSDGWNSHGLSSQHHTPPLKLFTKSLLQLRNSGVTAADFFADVCDSYGVDDSGPMPLSSSEEDGVVVPESHFVVSDTQLHALAQYDPLSSSEECGTDIYCAVKSSLS